jgi:hypothetical protein
MADRAVACIQTAAERMACTKPLRADWGGLAAAFRQRQQRRRPATHRQQRLPFRRCGGGCASRCRAGCACLRCSWRIHMRRGLLRGLRQVARYAHWRTASWIACSRCCRLQIEPTSSTHQTNAHPSIPAGQALAMPTPSSAFMPDSSNGLTHLVPSARIQRHKLGSQLSSLRSAGWHGAMPAPESTGRQYGNAVLFKHPQPYWVPPPHY